MSNDAVRLIEYNFNEWRIREFQSTGPPHAPPSSLICESASTVRRLWRFPPNWGGLSDDDLLALFDIS